MSNGIPLTVAVTLKGDVSTNATANGSASIQNIYSKLGADFASPTKQKKRHLNLTSGVVVTDVREGGFFDQNGDSQIL